MWIYTRQKTLLTMTFTFSNSILSMSSLLNTVLNFLLAIILPVQVYLLLIGGVILMDSYYGILLVRKEKGKFSALKMFKGIRNKIAIYTPAMLGVYWLDMHLLNEFVLQFINIQSAVTKIGCAVLISTELSSINENINKITGTSLRQRLKNLFRVAKDVKNDYDDISG